MTFDNLLFEMVDDVACISLNRPETLNSMTAKMGHELQRALVSAETNARAILLSGNGKGFCSGASLTEDLNFNDPELDIGCDIDRVFNPVISQVRNSKIPIVTAVHGAAAGFGCSLALAGDMIVAGESSYFMQAFCNIGLVPDGGSTYLLTKSIGRPRAMEMMLLGGKLTAPKALEWGLINRVVANDDVASSAMEIAAKLAKGPAAIGLIKQAAWSALDASFETALNIERRLQRTAGRTDDFREGIEAFREKRPAAFKGH